MSALNFAFGLSLILTVVAGTIAGVIVAGLFLRHWLIEKGVIMRPDNWHRRVKKEDRL